MKEWKDEMIRELEEMEAKNRKRERIETKHADQTWLRRNGRWLFNLASNNYLELAGDKRLCKAAERAVRKYGTGAVASRLIVGNHPLYDEVETSLQRWKKADAALVINSGYAANTGIISALMRRGDVVFSDRLNHASIVDGIRLSGARHQRYRHCDGNHLETLLKKAPVGKRKLIVTDTVFSMDGDVAPLAELITLKERYGAALMVDEAHAGGVFGVHGEGYAGRVNGGDRIDLHMGTFGKALGGFGAYVTGEPWLIDYLVQKMRSFIFSTALPPAVLASANEAIRIVEREERRRTMLHEKAAYFRGALKRRGLDIGASASQIVPVMIGSDADAVAFSQSLQQRGIAAVPVRPPTVPENRARIRLTVMSAHTYEDLQWAVEQITEAADEGREGA